MEEYRVWNAVNRPVDAELEDWRRRFIAVPSPAAGHEVIGFLRRDQARQASVERSEFGLEALTPDGWTEWCDDEGRGVLEHFETALREREAVPV
jgi:hypothetical protein